MNRLDYLAFMLRLWKVKTKDGHEWRASLENPYTGSRYLFTDLQSLFSHLMDIASEPEESLENSDGTLPRTSNNG